MRNVARTGKRSLLGTILICGLAVALSSLAVQAGEKGEFHTAGLFLDACSCSIPCACDMGSLMHGCHGIGAMTITSGAYKGTDLSGAKLAYATAPGDWIRFYLEPANPQQEAALEEFAKAAFSEYGKVESVKKAGVQVSGKDGHYTLKVDGGKIMDLTTDPVLGLDKKTPIVHGNLFNPLSPTVFQGKIVKGSYSDGERSFKLEGTNVYFNGHAKAAGKV